MHKKTVYEFTAEQIKDLIHEQIEAEGFYASEFDIDFSTGYGYLPTVTVTLTVKPVETGEAAAL